MMKIRIYILIIALSAGFNLIGATVSSSSISLTNEYNTACLTLANDDISVTVIPALGGKIKSIKFDGFDFVSRSKKPYSAREYGGDFSDKEFDGIDEIFPTLATCKYPTAPWKDIDIPPHGELFSQPWTVISTNNVICMEVKGKALPYNFRRTISLKDSSVILNYDVTNLSTNDIYYFYMFHPLLTGITGTEFTLDDKQQVKLSYNYKQFLGKPGTESAWGDLMIETNKVFKKNMFNENSGKYWKVLATIPSGETGLIYPNGKEISIKWNTDMQPKFAVWTSEGMGNLHHIAPEPTTSFEESLETAYNNGTAKILPANSTIHWQTVLKVK